MKRPSRGERGVCYADTGSKVSLNPYESKRDFNCHKFLLVLFKITKLFTDRNYLTISFIRCQEKNYRMIFLMRNFAILSDLN